MNPDDIARRCAAWVLWTGGDIDHLTPTAVGSTRTGRRVVCIEPDGPRRTWVLYEGGRQVGHVRGAGAPAVWSATGTGAGVDLGSRERGAWHPRR